MQFSLQTLMLSFVVVAASVSLCGPWGMLLAAVALAIARYVRMAKNRSLAWVNMMIILIVLVLSSCFIGMMVLATTEPREVSRRANCLINQKQIVIALLNYESKHGHLPPAYIADADGKPMHSWRVLILPYIEHKDIYDAYDFKESWNGPNNSKLQSQMPRIFACPSNSKKPNCTNYVAVVGSKTAWPGEKTSSLIEISAGDGTADTILLMELPNSDINWLEPRDLNYEELCEKMTPEKRADVFAAHSGRSVVSFTDGHQETMAESFLQKYLGALLTIKGGEKIDHDDESGPSYYHPALDAENIKWVISKIISLIILIAATLLIIYRPLPGREKNVKEQEEKTNRIR